MDEWNPLDHSIDRAGSIVVTPAIAAGAVAWTTPVVQVLSSGTAHAQTLTGCFPTCTITLQKTGANCECFAGPGPQCCDANTYVVQSLTVNCGPTCPGPVEITGQIEFPGISKPEACGDFPIYNFPCFDGSATFPARFPVRCADGQIHLFDGLVTAVCVPCALELAALPENLAFSDDTTTTTTEAESTTTTEAAGSSTNEAPSTTTTTEPDAPSTTEAPTTTTVPAPSTTAPPSTTTTPMAASPP